MNGIREYRARNIQFIMIIVSRSATIWSELAGGVEREREGQRMMCINIKAKEPAGREGVGVDRKHIREFNFRHE